MPDNKVIWTEDQQNAIRSDGTVLVSAAAGSGKTAVLAQYVLRLITGEHSVDADRLLVLTFTRDAASEMKRRIQKELDKRIADEGATAALLRQKQKLYTAHISTTDSFCSSLVRERFSALQIAPDFRIAGEEEIATLSAKALDAALEGFYAADSPDFRRLLRAFAAGGTDQGLRDVVVTIHRFLQNQPFREKWLDEMVRRYTRMPFSETEWAAELFRSLPGEIDALLAEVNAAAASCTLPQPLADILLPVLERDAARLREVRAAFEAEGYGGFCERVGQLFDRAYESDPVIDEKLLKGKKTAVKQLLSCRAAAREKLLSCLGADEELQALSGLMVTLSELVSAYSRELAAQKERRNIRTFSDVSLLTVRLLAECCPLEEAEFSTGGFCYRRTALAKELAARFYRIIIDEYQDVNLIQEVIYNCISDGGANLFMVGDIKQSIYGFRQSKAKLFNERKKRYRSFDPGDPVYPATIYLSRNFRSCEQVCETVNFIFSRLMPDYAPEEYLHFGATAYTRDEKRDTELVLIARENFDENASVTALEARYTAGRILQMMRKGYTVTDGNGERPLQFGDIAVLMRAKSGSESDEESKQKGSAEFVKQLAACGVPAFCEESENFFNAQEIRLLINLLRVIDNPSNDIALLSVLISPVFGFTPDDLAVIRLGSGKSSLYRSLHICREDDSPAGKKAARFLSELKRYRDLAFVCTVDELLEAVYGRTAIVAVTSAVNNGASPSRNLDLMRVYARKFAANGYKTLSDFVGYLERLMASGSSLASASQAKGGADSVQVMSIHKSKGLEFPVVFLVDTAREFNRMDFRSPVLADSEAYVGVKPLVNYVRTPTFPYRAITAKKQRENIDEEMRMLYVALTRAKEKLIIIGTDKEPEQKALRRAAEQTVSGEIPATAVYQSKRMLDWLLMAAAVNPSTRALVDETRAAGDSEAHWLLRKVMTEQELFPAGAASLEGEPAGESTEQPDYLRIYRENCAFRYPDADIIGVPQKVNPSQVSHSDSRAVTGRVLVTPSFAKDSARLTPTEIGTAHHEFLHYCDFAAARRDLDAEITRLRTAQKLTERQCGCLDRDKLTAILRHPLFDRVLRVPEGDVYREKQFTVFVHPSLTCEGMFQPNRRQIVDGEVDLVFIEDGALVIVDYKTDRVREAEELRRHKPQLDLYEEAMRQVLGLPVREKIVFSITLNDMITV